VKNGIDGISMKSVNAQKKIGIVILDMQELVMDHVYQKMDNQQNILHLNNVQLELMKLHKDIEKLLEILVKEELIMHI